MRSTRDLKDMVSGSRTRGIGNKKDSVLDEIPDIEGQENTKAKYGGASYDNGSGIGPGNQKKMMQLS
jgi:hypothetical protein